MNTKQLRQKILDLAIHGKLVPQDPNDEPAIELLKGINPNFTTCDNGHYPNKWQVTILGDIFDHNTGKALNSSNKEGTMKRYLTTSNVYWNRFDFTNVKQMLYKDTELDKCTIKKGDLLVCEGGDIGRSAIWKYDNNICIQNHIHRLRAKGDLCVEFFYYVIKYLKENNLIKGKGIGLLGLSSNVLHNIRIPVPPLNEQHSIVAEINRWFALIDQIEKSKTNIQNYISQAKTKILNLAIQGKLVPQDPNDEPAIELLKRINPNFTPCDKGQYEKIPKGWSITTIRTICNNINGLWKGKKKPFLKIGVIRNANFTKDFKIDYSKIEYIDVEQSSFSKRYLMDGDLIVEKSGGSDNNPVGRAVLYEGKNGVFSFSNFTMVLRIKNKDIITSKYLYYYIMSIYQQGGMRLMQTQTTGLHNLILDKYLSIPLYLPPLSEQQRIVKKIEGIFCALDKIQESLET